MLILMRAAASLSGIQVPVPAMVVKRHNEAVEKATGNDSENRRMKVERHNCPRLDDRRVPNHSSIPQRDEISAAISSPYLFYIFNETGFCCTAAAQRVRLLTIRRPPWLQQPVLGGTTTCFHGRPECPPLLRTARPRPMMRRKLARGRRAHPRQSSCAGWQHLQVRDRVQVEQRIRHAARHRFL